MDKYFVISHPPPPPSLTTYFFKIEYTLSLLLLKYMFLLIEERQSYDM